MKDSVTEINKNLQGINSSVEEAENQINDFEHKEAKNNQCKTTRENKLKEQGQCKQPLGQLQVIQNLHHSGARRR